MSATNIAKIGKSIQLAMATVAGLGVTFLLNYCVFRLHFNLSTASSINLLVVVLTAPRFGFWQATGSSFLAVACLDYFFDPPVLSLRIVNPQNWIALVSFEFTKLVVSRLSIQVQNHMREAIAHQSNAEKLYELSRNVLLLLNRKQAPGPQIAMLILKNVGVKGVAVFDSTFVRSDRAGICAVDDEELARNACLRNANQQDPQLQRWVRVLRVVSSPIGAIVMHGGNLTPILVEAVSSLVATALERARSFDKESRAEAARHSEQLRKTVLDGLAHAFKTPLTVIHTGTSGLLEMKNLSRPQTELLELINQQSTLLNTLTNRFLRMAKLECAEIQLGCEQLAVPRLIDEILDECSDQLCGHFSSGAYCGPQLVGFRRPPAIGHDNYRAACECREVFQ